MRRFLVVGAVGVALALLGLGGAMAVTGDETVGTQTFTNVVTYTIPTITQTVTETVTVTDPGTTTQPTTTTTPPPTLGTALPSLLPESSGTQLFVAPGGSGSFCLDTAPCSLQTGINTATAGQRIEALAGTYAGNWLWSPSGGQGHNGTAAEPITLESFSGPVVLHAAGSASEILRVTGGASFIRIKGLTIEAQAPLWTGTGHQPFYVSGAGGAHDIDILGNDFSGKRYNITAFLAGPGATHINVVGNRCHDFGDGSTQRQCLYIQADSGMVANNLVYGDPNGFGIQVRGDTAKTCNVIVTDNTVVDIGVQRGIYVENNCSGVRIRNNVVAYSGGEEIYGLAGSGSDPAPSSNRAFTNLVWDTVGNKTGNTSGHKILDFTDGLGDYVGPGQNKVADPLFVDRAGRDYHLQAGSPAIGVANPDYSLPFDFDGKARDANPDAGALEG